MAEQVEGKSQSVDTGMGFGVSTGLEGLVPDSRLQELDKELQNKIKEKFPEGAPKTDPSKEKEPKNKLPDSTASEDDPSELLKKTTFFVVIGISPKEDMSLDSNCSNHPSSLSFGVSLTIPFLIFYSL